MKINYKKQWAPVGLIIGCILFGLGSVIVVHIHMGAYAIAFWRLLVASIIFAILGRVFAQKFPKNQQALHHALLSGVFLGFDLALWHESIYAIGPGIATLLNSLQIFWLAAIGRIWFAENLSKSQIFSLITALVGVTLIGSPEFKHNNHALWGFTSGILSGLMLALSMVFVRKTHETTPTPIFPLMLIISIGGMAALILPTLFFNQHNMIPQSAVQLGWIVIYGSVMQCFAWGLIAYCIPLLSLSLTGLLLLSEPVAALIIDYIFLNKSISSWQWFGAILTMFAIYLGSIKTKAA